MNEFFDDLDLVLTIDNLNEYIRMCRGNQALVLTQDFIQQDEVVCTPFPVR